MENTCKGRPSTARRNRYVSCTCCLFALGILLLPARAHTASAALAARYLEAEGTQLTIEINPGSPPPASLILVQRLPSGVRLLNSSPAANNINTDRGEIKWLLHSIPPGSLLVEMTLDRAVADDEISAEIRFKPPEGGEMTTLPVTKP
jgi:hypothetical protein